jgi:hypothetical protein
MTLIGDIEAVALKIKHGLAVLLHAAEHEVPAVIGLFANVYGPEIVAHAIATHKGAVTLYADKAIEVAEADTKALVQSSLVEKFGLPPTAAQFIASGIHHLFTIGEAKVNSLIDAGAAKAIAATGADPAV